MDLNKKKKLAAKVLNVGVGRIWFSPEGLEDIEEALTRQDIRDLFKEKLIRIKSITGKKKKEKRKTRRRAGKIKKDVKNKKRYIHKIRKMRAYLKSLRRGNVLNSEEYNKLRRYAKSGLFDDLKNLKDYLAKIKNIKIK